MDNIHAFCVYMAVDTLVIRSKKYTIIKIVVSLTTKACDRATSVKRNRRIAECPVDSQGVSAPRESAERT